jgi:hypothetical protein
MPTLPTLSIGDQLVASLVTWLNTEGDDDWPTSAELEAVVNVRGAARLIPCIAVGHQGMEEILPMRGTWQVEVAFDLITELGAMEPESEMADRETEHRRWSEMLTARLAAMTVGPGPLAHIWVHGRFLGGREHQPDGGGLCVTRQNVRFIVTLTSED